MLSPVVFSRQSDNWATPVAFYEALDREFGFTFDPCPLQSETDGLTIPWLGRVFINPPYSNIRAFLEKGIREVDTGNATVCVFLIPARTDTRWFHDLVYHQMEIRFIKGRLKFGEGRNSAPFPSMLCIYRSL